MGSEAEGWSPPYVASGKRKRTSQASRAPRRPPALVSGSPEVAGTAVAPTDLRVSPAAPSPGDFWAVACSRVSPTGRVSFRSRPLGSPVPWRPVVLLNVSVGPGKATLTHFRFGPQGRKAKDIIGAARAHLARMIGGEPQDIVFTSGGTEVSGRGPRAAEGGSFVAPFLYKTERRSVSLFCTLA